MAKTQSDEDGVRPDPLLTVPEAARRLHISRSLMYELVRRGLLPIVHIGRAMRIRPEDVEALIGQPEGAPARTKGRRKRKET